MEALEAPIAVDPPRDAATVADVGEFALIDRVTALLRSTPAVLLGPGDDAAVVGAPDGRVVLTTDVLVEGVHFRRDWSSAYDVGRKAAAQSLADVVAMGANPTALVVGLAAPRDLSVAWAEDFARGLDDESAGIGAAVVGGDMVGSATLTISVTALGDLAGRAPVTRAGARVGDRVVLIGVLGRAAAGLALLERGDADLLDRFAELVDAHRAPTPPYAIALALAPFATAMIDVSDGLIADAGHIAAASGVSLVLEELPVPVVITAAAAALGVEPGGWLLGGGEDHAFLATVGADAPVPDGVVIIGRVVEGRGVRDAATGAEIVHVGWTHFGGAP